MSELPPGWEWTTLGEISETSLGKMLDKKRATGEHLTPYLRNINVRWNRFDLADLASMDIRPAELDRVLARPGDVVVCEGGEPGRAAVWKGPDAVAIQKALHRVRPRVGISAQYLVYLLWHLALSGQLSSHFTGSTIKHLPKEKLRLVSVPLPPLAEQERIVAAIEAHLSRLDSAANALTSAAKRLTCLRQALAQMAWSTDASEVPLGSIGEIVTGSTPRSGDPDVWGDDVPFVTPGDLAPGGRVQTTARWLSEKGRRAVRLLPAESVLVTCIGATLGKTSIGMVELATNQQINAVAPDKLQIDPRFLLALLSSPEGQRRLWGASSSTTLPILNKSKFSALRVPLPPMTAQRVLCEQIDAAESSLSRSVTDVSHASNRAGSLRRAVLAAAFSGELVPQDPNDEPASVLLERIRVNRGTSAPVRRQ